MKRIIVILVLVLVIGGALVGLTLYRQQTPDLVQQKPDQVVNAGELIAAFEKDTASASQRFVDRILEVSGKVKSVDSAGTIVLGVDNSESSVSCGLDRRHLEDVRLVEPGKNVSIQGRCSGYSKANGDDLLAALGTNVELSFAGLKKPLK